MLIYGREIIFISNNEKQLSLILHSSEADFYSEIVDAEDGMIDWFPKAKYCQEPSVTQFMYDKDLHPKVLVDTVNKNIKIID